MLNITERATPELVQAVRSYMDSCRDCNGALLQKITNGTVNKTINKFIAAACYGQNWSQLDYFEKRLCLRFNDELCRLGPIVIEMRRNEREKMDLKNDLEMLGEDGVNWWVVRAALKPFGYPIKSKRSNIVKVQRWANKDRTRCYVKSSYTVAKSNIRHNSLGNEFSAKDLYILKEKCVKAFEEHPEYKMW